MAEPFFLLSEPYFKTKPWRAAKIIRYFEIAFWFSLAGAAGRLLRLRARRAKIFPSAAAAYVTAACVCKSSVAIIHFSFSERFLFYITPRLLILSKAVKIVNIGLQMYKKS